MNSDYSNHSIRTEVNAPITEVKQFVAGPASTASDKLINKDETTSQQKEKPSSVMKDMQNFVKGPLQVAAGLTLLGAGAAASVVLLPLTIGGTLTGLALGTLAALLSKDSKTAKQTVAFGAMAGASFGSLGGVTLSLMGMHLLKTSQSESGKNLGIATTNMASVLPNAISNQVAAFNKLNPGSAKEPVNVKGPANAKAEKIDDSEIGTMKMSEWAALAKTNPDQVAKELYSQKLPDESFDKLTKNLSSRLNANEFGKLVSSALREEINESQHPGNLLRLTTTTEGKLFKEFRIKHLEPALANSAELKTLKENVKKADSLVLIDKDTGAKSINTNGKEDADAFVKSYLGAVTTFLNQDNDEIKAFKEILTTLNRDVGNKQWAEGTEKTEGADSKAVSSLIFLRIFNPNLTMEDKKLMDLTKITQNLANKLDFGAKEAHMVGFNEVLAANKNQMEELINQFK